MIMKNILAKYIETCMSYHFLHKPCNRKNSHSYGLTTPQNYCILYTNDSGEKRVRGFANFLQ